MAKDKPKFDGDGGAEGLERTGLRARRTDPDPEDEGLSLKDLKGSRSSRGYKPWEPKADGSGRSRTGAGPT